MHCEDQNLKKFQIDNDSIEEITKSNVIDICNSAASDPLKSDDSAKLKKATQPKSSETYTFKFDDPRFLDFGPSYARSPSYVTRGSRQKFKTSEVFLFAEDRLCTAACIHSLVESCKRKIRISQYKN